MAMLVITKGSSFTRLAPKVVTRVEKLSRAANITLAPKKWLVLIIIPLLVGGIPTPLKNMKVKWD